MTSTLLIQQLIENDPQCQNLVLNSAMLHDRDDLLDALQWNTVVQNIHILSWDTGGERVAAFLQQNINLRSVAFTNCKWSVPEWLVILQALQNSVVTRVRLSYTNINAGPLLYALSNMPALKNVSFHHVFGHINSNFGHDSLSALMVNVVVKVARFELYCSLLTDTFLEQLSPVLEDSRTTLTSLTLDTHAFTEYGASLLIKSLHINTSIHTLILDNNNLSAAVGQMIGTLLRSNRTLVYLSLQDNPLQFAGGFAIAQGLLCNTTLRHVDLERTQLDWRNEAGFAQVLTQNQKLLYLCVAGNALGPCVLLAKALTSNHGLLILDIAGNGVINLLAFADALQNNTKLRKVYVYNDTLQYTCEELTAMDLRLQSVLAVNASLHSFFFPNQSPALSALLERNRTRSSLWWTTGTHQLFLPRCHQTLWVILLAAQRFSVVLPMELWCTHVFVYYLFSHF